MDRITNNDEEDLVWRSVVEAMTERGATNAEAIEAADLVVASYRRRRAAELMPELDASRPTPSA
jgi:hypothetical protein